jgi:hypothetical protein
MYEARLHGALAADYEAVRDFLGEERFGNLVHGYILAHPSRSYTLNRLGDQLPEFIRNEWKRAPRRAFLYDLARYELARTVVFDAEETASLTAGEIAAVPAEAWATARLRTIAALRLLKLRYPVHRYVRAVIAGKRRPKVLPATAWIAVYRVNYGMGTLELTRESYRLLSAILAGKPLAEALEEVPATRASIAKWFKMWASAGLFSSPFQL